MATTRVIGARGKDHFRRALKILIPAALVLLVLTLGSSPMALASHTHTTFFEAILIGKFAFTSATTVAASGKGASFPLGRVTAKGTVSIASNTGTPSVILTTANGDELFLTTTGTATFTSSTTALFSGTYTITGGTGYLVHAAGHGTVNIVADLTSSSSGTFFARICGDITV